MDVELPSAPALADEAPSGAGRGLRDDADAAAALVCELVTPTMTTPPLDVDDTRLLIGAADSEDATGVGMIDTVMGAVATTVVVALEGPKMV